jgi:hypothetical protein
MQSKAIRINRENIVYISFHTDYNAKTVKTADKLLDILINSIRFNRQIGYVGFYTRKALRSQLKFNIFGKHCHKGRPRKFPAFPFKKTEVLHELTLTLKKCLSMLPAKSTWIFVFPTFDLFIKSEMRGIGGFTPWKHTILLTLHPEAKRWKKVLRTTLAHEFNHAIRLRYFPSRPNNTLLEAIIFEGLADNFSHQLVGGNPNPWAIALSPQQCKEIFPKIKKLLNSKSKKLYYSVFFQDKKYPLWTGYSLGYQIVKQFLKNNPEMDWHEIIMLESEEILEKSDF